MKYIYFLFLVILVFTSEEINSQEIWKKLQKPSYSSKNKELYKKKHFPSNYELVSLNVKNFKNNLNFSDKKQSTVIQLPNFDGTFAGFTIKETSNLAPKLAAMFPAIKSYTAQGIDDPTAVAKISMGTDGFHAVIFSGKRGTIYLDPYSKDNKEYIVYKRSSLSNLDRNFKCLVNETTKKELSNTNFAKNANDGTLRTFRLALVCSGEYAQFHLTNQGVLPTASDTEKKAAVLSAMNTSMTRINGVFERDLAVKMVIVGNNDKVIFLDAATDNITDGNATSMIDEVQTICDTQIGDANYDIGHIFSISGSGLAGLGVVCISGFKARGVTGIASPIGDPYDIDYVVHEMGHQFGATHTQNNDCSRINSTAVEPGSASTIMGYSGICAPNVLGIGSATGNSDDYFHAVSINQMWNTLQSSATCGAQSNTNNTAPVANAGLDYSIPKSTPFVLRGNATDVDGISGLTYNWEQIDTEVAVMPPVSTNTVGPSFRSLPSKVSPNRYMPDLTTVVSGNTSTTWEVLPSVARDLNFSFLVRDNHAGGGSTARDDTKITVTSAAAFTVTAPSTAVSWDVGSTQTITWNKGTTDIAPINCSLVNIKLSIDGGLTFPITIKGNTLNDGSEAIIIPNNVTASARIMVEAADNIFYNVNATDFTINSTIPTFILTNTSGVQTVCNTGSQSVSYSLNFDFVNGFSEPVSFSTIGQPTGSIVSFSPTTISANGNVIMTISNLNGVASQAYTVNIIGTATSLNQNIDVTLNVLTQNFATSTLTSPTNNATNIILTELLKWNADTNASSYDVQIASDSGFATIISSGNVSTNSYTSSNLNPITTYYWRVKPKNSCGSGVFSSAFSFTTKIGEYCFSTFTDEVGGTEHITNVTFNTINNNSGNDLVDGYEDFTSISTNVKRGDLHQISVTLDTGGFQDHCFVFIDWNQDYVFNLNTERYDLGSVTANIGTKNFTVTVPSDAKFGNTRLRVIIEYDDPTTNYGQGACDTDHLTEWGETEDYTITVDNTASIEDIAFSKFNLYPNPTKGAFKLNFEVVNTDKVTVQLFDIRGRLIGEKKYLNTNTLFSENIVFNKASSGFYLLKIINGNLQITRKLIIK